MATGEADGGNSARTWRDLLAQQLELRAAISDTDDPSERAILVEQFNVNRQTIRRLEQADASSPGGVDGDLNAPGQVDAGVSDARLGILGESPTADGASPQTDARPAAVVGGGSEGDEDLDRLLDAIERRPEASTMTGPIGVAASQPWWQALRPGRAAAGAVASLTAVGLFLVAAVMITDGPTDSDASSQISAGAEADLQQLVDELRGVLDALGLQGIVPHTDGNGVQLRGAVATEEQKRIALRAVASLAANVDVDASGLVVGETVMNSAPDGDESAVTGAASPDGLDARQTTVQRELDRILASSPLVFGIGESDLSPLQRQVLERVVELLRAYADVRVRVIGHADGAGSTEGNFAVSAARADAVHAYLVTNGISADRLVTEARGDASSTGSDSLAGLERRVELEVEGVLAPREPGSLWIGLVAPSAANDLAFTQSMVDALAIIEAERAGTVVQIRDNTFVPDEAAAALREFAERGFDLVIAHGSQYGPLVDDLAAEHPDVAFAWGTSSAPSTLPNVYGYNVAADEGGYLLGALAATLSSRGVLGVVAPIEVGDAKLFAEGFRSGAAMERPSADIRIGYTGSFSDLSFAREVAHGHVDAGADALAGTSQMVPGAVEVAVEHDTLWFGNQTDQSALAPARVVASQVYHWEVVLREVLIDLDAGALNGRGLVADLSNGGITIEYNPSYPVADGIRLRISTIADGIMTGSVITG